MSPRGWPFRRTIGNQRGRATSNLFAGWDVGSLIAYEGQTATPGRSFSRWRLRGC